MGQFQTLIADAGAEGHLSGVQVLIATAITGVAQALAGGQPLLIVGVAEPVVLIYSFMYQFAKGAYHGPHNDVRHVLVSSVQFLCTPRIMSAVMEI